MEAPQGAADRPPPGGLIHGSSQQGQGVPRRGRRRKGAPGPPLEPWVGVQPDGTRRRAERGRVGALAPSPFRGVPEGAPGLVEPGPRAPWGARILSYGVTEGRVSAGHLGPRRGISTGVAAAAGEATL